jgi:hypothetical protein
MTSTDLIEVNMKHDSYSCQYKANIETSNEPLEGVVFTQQPEQNTYWSNDKTHVFTLKDVICYYSNENKTTELVVHFFILSGNENKYLKYVSKCNILFTRNPILNKISRISQ